MALLIYVDGTDRGAAVRLVGESGSGEGFHTESAAMAGVVSSGIIEVEDPDGSLDIRGWRPAYIVEDTATPERIWTGFIANVDQTAGPFRSGPGRVHHCETVDLNWNLTRIRIGVGGNRPAETDLARVTWLLGHASLSGLVYAGDLTDLTNNPVSLGEADFTDEFPIDVLTDLSPVAGKTAYVTWDTANARPQLFYDLTTTTTYDSPAAISDVLADVESNPTTVFPPRIDPVLHRVIEDGYSDVWLRYKNGLVHVHDAAFEAAHARRDLILSTSRIGSAVTAAAYANKALAAHNHETDSIDCEVEVEAAHVNDILEGHRLYFKSSHLTGFTSYAYTRVERRTVRQVDDQSRRFVIGLQLSDRILSALPGGPPPSDFPHQTGPLTIIQDSEGLSNRVFANAPADGNTLVVVTSKRAGAPSATGYTDSGEGAVTGGVDYVAGFYKTASGDSDTFPGSLDQATGWYELPSNAILVDHASDSGSAYAASTPDVTIPAGGIAFMVAGIGQGGGFDAGPGYSGAWTPAAGWTEDFDSKVQSGHPATFIARRSSSTGETVSPSATFLNDGQGPWPWQALVMVFGPDTASEPPAPGQWTTWAEVAMSTVGGVSTGTTAFPYADGSLEVKVQSQPILPANYSETDGATGDFALSWEIDADEHVYVRYQGR